MRRRVLAASLFLAVMALVVSAASPAGAMRSNAGHSATPAGEKSLFEWFEDGYSGPFDISLGAPATLRVVDAFCRGDVFEVYDNGALIGTTSAVEIDPECDDEPFLDSIFTAWRDRTYSRGLFHLDAGDHSLEFIAIVNYFEGGAAFFGLNY